MYHEDLPSYEHMSNSSFQLDCIYSDALCEHDSVRPTIDLLM